MQEILALKKDNFYIAITFNFLLFKKLMLLPKAIRRYESFLESSSFIYGYKYSNIRDEGDSFRLENFTILAQGGE